MTDFVKSLLSQIEQCPGLKEQLLKGLGVNVENKATSRWEMKMCPALAEMSLLQLTYFNNGPKDERPKNTAQHVLTIEAWTAPTDTLELSAWQWKGSVSLLTHADMEFRIKKLRNLGSISERYHARLAQLLKDVEPEPLSNPRQPMFGLLSTKTKGTTYHEDQFIVSYVENGLPGSVSLVIGDDLRYVERFDSNDMKGQPLKGKAKLQARIALRSFHSNWSTE